MIACSQCGTAPERRLDPATGMRLFACPSCRHRGEATTSEGGAAGSWSLVNDPDLSRHKCKGAPPPRFFVRGGAWGARCGCGLEVEGFGSIPGARAGWERALR